MPFIEGLEGKNYVLSFSIKNVLFLTHSTTAVWLPSNLSHDLSNEENLHAWELWELVL